MSWFHDEHGVYAEGIHVDTATLPDGWRDRLVGWDLQSSRPAEPHFLVIRERAHMLPESVGLLVRQRVRGWLDYYDGDGMRRGS